MGQIKISKSFKKTGRKLKAIEETILINLESRMDALIKKGKKMSKREFLKLVYMSGAYDLKRGKIKFVRESKDKTQPTKERKR